ncbi:MAG TPA: DUF3592 domain-containing protein [Thermoanaerobaculia bacterium]|nr:DUF3592 domain-containing protein [Thermoanaerobaculia bacterium]
MRGVLVMMLGAVLVTVSGCSALVGVIDQATGADEARLLRQTGMPAEAEVLRIWDTGTTVNDDPVIGMEVEVLPAEGEPFQAVIPRTWISRLDIPRFQPGRVIAVRFDPETPARVALDDPPFPANDEEAGEPEGAAGVETSVGFGLRLCARTREGDGEGVETVFLVTGPAGRRFESQRIAPARGRWTCVLFPEDFAPPVPVPPGRYRYEIRVNGETAERGVLTLDG